MVLTSDFALKPPRRIVWWLQMLVSGKTAQDRPMRNLPRGHTT